MHVACYVMQSVMKPVTGKMKIWWPNVGKCLPQCITLDNADGFDKVHINMHHKARLEFDNKQFSATTTCIKHHIFDT